MKDRMQILPNYGDLISIPEFIEACHTNSFIDSDGYGYWATQTSMCSNEMIHSSNIVKNKFVRPHWATHIIWFNK